MSKTKSDPELSADRDLYSGLIRLHVLHHAAKEPIFGLGMIQELARHGYNISPGSLYPILHSLEQKGYLRATQQERAHLYRPARPKHQVIRGMVREFVDRVFNGAGRPLVVPVIMEV